MKLLVFYNQKSGSCKFINWQKYVSNFCKREKIDTSWVFINKDKFDIYSDDILKIIRVEKTTHILIIGGDGTMSSISSAIVRNKVKLPVGVFPTGSGNVMSMILGVRKNLNYLKKPKIRKIYPTIVNDKYIFFLAICFGKIASITIEAHDYYKHLIGFASYIVTYVIHLFRNNEYLFEELKPKKIKHKGHSMHYFAIEFIEKFSPVLYKNLLLGNRNSNIIRVKASHNKPMSDISLLIRFLFGRMNFDEVISSDYFEVKYNKNIPVYIDGESINLNEGVVRIKKSSIPIYFMY